MRAGGIAVGAGPRCAGVRAGVAGLLALGAWGAGTLPPNSRSIFFLKALRSASVGGNKSQIFSWKRSLSRQVLGPNTGSINSSRRRFLVLGGRQS